MSIESLEAVSFQDYPKIEPRSIPRANCNGLGFRVRYISAAAPVHARVGDDPARNVKSGWKTYLMLHGWIQTKDT